MLRRVYEFLAIIQILGGLFALGFGVFFLYRERFIEGFVTGGLGFLVIRSGLLLVRLSLAKKSLEDSQRRILSFQRGEEDKGAGGFTKEARRP